MPRFHYKAVRGSGETYEGVLEAPDRFSLYGHIRREGGVVLSISEEGKRTVAALWNTLQSFLGAVKISEKIAFAKNIAAMIEAGLALSRALDVMERQTTNLAFKRMIASLAGDIKRGENFHSALAKFPRVFPHLFVSMVKAGEESGKLVDSLKSVAYQMERSYLLARRVKGALIYPGVVVSTMAAVGVLMMIYVVPTLTETFEELEVELPRSTTAIIATSSFLSEHVLFAGFLFLAALLAFVGALRSRLGKQASDFVILRLPIIAPLVREVNAARTARTLSSLLSAGVEVVSALSITRDVMQNVYYKEVLSRAGEYVKKGKPLSQAFERTERLYPVVVSEIVSVGEETGKLAAMLTDIADFYEDEVEQRTKNISTVIEPLLMIFIGSVVGFFALSMISPIYSISQGL